MSLWMPFFFFLVVDSWLWSAGWAVVVSFAGCVEFGSAVVSFAGCVEFGSAVLLLAGGFALLSDAEGVASAAAGCADGGVLPGVTVSTVAVLPVPAPPPTLKVGGVPNVRVSSPVSLAGVMVGAPL